MVIKKVHMIYCSDNKDLETICQFKYSSLKQKHKFTHNKNEVTCKMCIKRMWVLQAYPPVGKANK